MVAIKDFGMPKNCIVCPFCERMGSHLHCPVARTHIDIRYTESRHPDCPLVEIEDKEEKWIPVVNVDNSPFNNVQKRKVGKILVNDKYRVPMYECLGCRHPVMEFMKYCPSCGNNIEECKK